MPHAPPRPAFTLIETMIIAGIAAVVFVIVLVAVDPAARFRAARDARRMREAEALLNAINLYLYDTGGKLPSVIAATDTPQVIGTAASGCDTGCAAAGLTAASCIDLESSLAGQIGEMPVDPAGAPFSNAFTGYYVQRLTGTKVEVGACNPEDEPFIVATR
jgi:type II secretory pathway pseudopilin PulG